MPGGMMAFSFHSNVWPKSPRFLVAVLIYSTEVVPLSCVLRRFRAVAMIRHAKLVLIFTGAVLYIFRA